jgi:flagellar FliJ protein
MPRFIFKLEPVLRQRLHLEKEKQRELALIQQQMVALQQELRGLNDAVQSAATDVRDNRLVGRLDMAFLAAHRRFMAAMQRKGMELVQRMALVQRQVEEAQKALADAARQRKAMEKLREKHLARWKQEQDRLEMLASDELNTQLSYLAGVTGADTSAPVSAVVLDGGPRA